MGKISVSYHNQNFLPKCTTKHRNFGAEVKTWVLVAQSIFKSETKMNKFSRNIFPTVYWFSDTFLCTMQCIKNFAHCFFVSARYCRFSLSAWSKMKNFYPDHKSKIIHFFINKQLCFHDLGQNFSFLTMLIVKICDILPKRKNNAPNFLYVAKYMKMYQKIIKKLRKCWGKN